MSRTDLPAETLARSLRAMAGDGSIEWTYKPMQTRVLLDVAGMLDENAKLRELLSESLMDYKLYAKKYGLPPYFSDVNEHLDARLRELGVEVDE